MNKKRGLHPETTLGRLSGRTVYPGNPLTIDRQESSANIKGYQRSVRHGWQYRTMLLYEKQRMQRRMFIVRL